MTRNSGWLPHAKRKFIEVSGAERLCQSIGNLPFAVEIAGNMLKERKQTPQALLEEYEKRLHELQLHAPPRGRETIAALIDMSLNRLDDEARDIFIAFGAFFAPQITAQLMALYRKGDNGNVGPVESALFRLHTSGLAVHIPASDENVPYFRIHDLGFSYAVTKNNDKAHYIAQSACLDYIKQHNSSSKASFNALLPVIDGLVGAAKYAFNTGIWKNAEQFAIELCTPSGNGIIFNLGLYEFAGDLLNTAILAAKKRNDPEATARHLLALGNHHFNQHVLPLAGMNYEEALKTAILANDKPNQASVHGALGNLFTLIHRFEEAELHYKSALAIESELGANEEAAKTLADLAMLAQLRGEYSQSSATLVQALTMFGNSDLSEADKAKLANNLGISYFNQKKYNVAEAYFGKSLKINRSNHYQKGMAKDLYNMGMVCEHRNEPGDLEHAVDYYRQSREIYQEQGMPRQTSQLDQIIARVQAKLADNPPPTN